MTSVEQQSPHRAGPAHDAPRELDIAGRAAGIRSANIARLISQLRATLGKMGMAIDTLGEAVVWTDAGGAIQWANRAFDVLTNRTHLWLLGRSLASVLPLNKEGRPLAPHQHPANAALLAAETSVGGDIEHYEFERAGERRDLQIRSFVLWPRSNQASAVLVIQDITDKMLAERWLGEESARMELLGAVAAAANEAQTPSQAIEAVLPLLCRYTNWPAGHAWRVQSDPSQPLVSTGVWYSARTGPARPTMDPANPHQLPLDVCASGQIQWSSTLSPDATLCGAFAFPVFAGKEVVAVVEFHADSMMEPDQAFLSLIQQIGTQLGRVFERSRSQADLLAAKAHLESRVEERTAELRRLNAALLREAATREDAQTALRETAMRYRSLVQSVRDIIFLISADGRIESLNPAYEPATGFQAASWCGRRVLRLIAPCDRAAAVEAVRRLAAGQEVTPLELRLKKRNGGSLIAEVSLTPRLNRGRLEGISGIARDITARRRAEEQIRLHGRALASTSEGISITDASLPFHPLIYVNPGFERLTGYSAREVLGRNCAFLQGPATDPRAIEEIRAALRGERPCTVELLNYRKDGSPFWNRLSVTPMLDAAGRLTHFIGVQSDITGQKEAEKMKADLVSTVSHELRTPLTSLRGFAELMLDQEFPIEKRRKFLGIIKQEATRLTYLINDFLDVQRMESGRQPYQFTAQPLRRLLQEAIALFREANPAHEFVLEGDADLPNVMVDADRLRQVLSNLFSNAVKFSPRGGAVTVGAGRDGGHARCWVRDQGVGIAPEALPNLFQKFYRVDNSETRRIGGTGLGLAIVKQIVEAHQGHVWVESAPGQGSTFFFTLPLEPSPQHGDAGRDATLGAGDLSSPGRAGAVPTILAESGAVRPTRATDWRCGPLLPKQVGTALVLAKAQ